MNTTEMNKGATKHCSWAWGLRKLDSRYPESMPEGTHFTRFAKVGKVNPLNTNFTKWSNTLKEFVGEFPTNYLSVFDHFVGLANDRVGKNKQNELTEKAKKLVHACDRKDFTIDKITKDTYTCSLHFVGGNGATEEDPDPINASLLECELVKKKDKGKDP